MNPKASLLTRRPSLLAGLVLLAAFSLQAQGAAPTPASAAPADEETLLLSLCTVTVDSEKGYYATQTLNGTRLKTDLKDIGSSLTVFTEQMMDDLGATSIY